MSRLIFFVAGFTVLLTVESVILHSTNVTSTKNSMRESASSIHQLDTPLLADIEMNSIWTSTGTTQGYYAKGYGYSAYVGRFLAKGGDIDGDGFPDIIVSSLNIDKGVYVLFGRSGNRAHIENLYTYNVNDNNNRGWRITHQSAEPYVESVDFNGDGFSDILISRTNGIGSVSVVFGRAAYSALTLPVSAGPTQGFRIDGPADTTGFGRFLSSADLNGDNFGDILIGNRASIVFVLFGRSNDAWTVTNFQLKPSATFTAGLQGLNGEGPQGFKIAISMDASAPYTRAVDSAGDFNGDGYDDIILGSTAYKGYIVFGKPGNNLVANINLATFTSSATTGIILQVASQVNNFFQVVRGIGDVNGDGFDDVAIHSQNQQFLVTSHTTGVIYVVFGHGPGTAYSTVTLGMSFAPPLGFQIGQRYASGILYDGLSSAGDVNGDGFSDILLGWADANGINGRTYVIYGSASPTTVNFEAGIGFSGITIYPGSYDVSFGSAVVGVGDVNNDGVDDFMIGSGRAKNSPYTDSGRVYIMYGSNGGFTRPPTIKPTRKPTTAPTSYSPTIAPSSKPVADPTAEPTCTPTFTPSAAPVPDPSAAPTTVPSGVPSEAPTAVPSANPTLAPSADPSASPTCDPSVSPSAVPSAAPSLDPTSLPTTAVPSADPTFGPTAAPSAIPSAVPSAGPTTAPSAAPSSDPTPAPSVEPTASPTASPTEYPTVFPTADPSADPSAVPSTVPSAEPSAQPTTNPTAQPTVNPSAVPSAVPSTVPSVIPSATPTAAPSAAPSTDPTTVPTADPTRDPSASPSAVPSAVPTTAPSADPTTAPSTAPSADPTLSPSTDPTADPTGDPSVFPTAIPSCVPSALPTTVPTTTPTAAPSAPPFNWYLGANGESCTQTCTKRGGVCQQLPINAVTTVEAFSAVVSAAIPSDKGLETGESAVDFCNGGINVQAIGDVPSAASFVTDAAIGSGISTYCSYPTSAPALESNCDAISGSSTAQRFCACHTPPELWVKGYSGESCTQTCGRVSRVCVASYFDDIVTQEAFYAMVAGAVSVNDGALMGGADALCNQGISGLTFTGAPCSAPSAFTYSYYTGATHYEGTHCNFPTSLSALTGDCETEYTFPPTSRFCPCVESDDISLHRALSAVSASGAPAIAPASDQLIEAHVYTQPQLRVVPLLEPDDRQDSPDAAYLQSTVLDVLAAIVGANPLFAITALFALVLCTGYLLRGTHKVGAVCTTSDIV